MRTFTALFAFLALSCNPGGTSDFDGDGAADDVDCAAQDAAIYPGADETCDDQIDNDCDTDADWNDRDCWVTNGDIDVDDDGDGYTEQDGDCHDDDATINPSVNESASSGNCDDGYDNDCDGTADDCAPAGGVAAATVEEICDQIFACGGWGWEMPEECYTHFIGSTDYGTICADEAGYFSCMGSCGIPTEACESFQSCEGSCWSMNCEASN